MNIRIVLFFLLLISASQLVKAQDIEHYKYIATTNKNTEIILESLDSVISKSFRKDEDVFIDYSLKYIELAKKHDYFESAAKKAINLQGPLTSHGNDPYKAVSIIKGVLAYKYKIKDSFLLGSLYNRKAKAYQSVSLEDAVKNYTLAIDNYAVKDTLLRADNYLFRGQTNSNLGNFIEAGKDFNKAYSLYQSTGRINYMLYSQQGNIAMLSKNGFLEEAYKERLKFISKAIELERPQYLVTAYYNQALDFKQMGKFDKEFESLLNAKNSLKGNENNDLILNIHAKLCEYYLRANDITNAREQYNLLKSIPFKEESELLKSVVFNGAKARYLLKTGEYEASLLAALKKLKNSETLGHSEEVMDSNLLISEIYEKLGNYKDALINKNEYLSKRNSLFSENKLNSLAFYQSRYESEKKEKELFEKTANIERLQGQNDEFKRQSIYLSIAGVLLFGIILLYRAQRQHKTNKLLQERFSQDLLISQEEERKRISNDLHDGLGQRLLVLKNKLIANGDLESQKMVDTTIEEVRTITRDLHPFQLQELGITKAIEYTISEIDENTGLFISSEIDNIDNVFTKEQEVNIYRIVQEALSNVVKHAAAEATKLTVTKAMSSVIIAIRDNGSGFDFPEKYQDTKSLGLKTLLERTKSLNGQMKVQSRKENGTLLEFQFPI
ncbi:hypothetical protein ULMS_06720 [Patiriisocius marinistellae]|uniref:histidine kinase n=1 Tax=Patiriisocius marinistellae TaxID=2494560 RepID=A0A5J4FVL7_9FLAO|nr:sensor histidine kinase [Patiriisocius marinistellae]GEQ85164.1 hypothetical protein ULMS_06720 [Patiriisocius marinistellae]